MISIGCFESVAPLYMPKLVAGFKKCYPEITLHLYDGEQHELMHGLHRGRFDWRWFTIWSSAIRSIKSGSMPRINPTRCCPPRIRWRRRRR